MRRLISFIFATSLAIGGAAALVWMLFFADRARGLFLIGAAVIMVIGAFWLWEDFLPSNRNTQI